jgi:hypothetical protein
MTLCGLQSATTETAVVEKPAEEEEGRGHSHHGHAHYWYQHGAPPVQQSRGPSGDVLVMRHRKDVTMCTSEVRV